MGKEQILIWPIIITCIVVIILNTLYRWPLYYEGVQLIISMQTESSIIFDWLFLFITMIIDPTIVALICILILILSHKKEKGFTLIVFILLNTFLAAVLKAYDTDPRPIWTEKQVRNIGLYCPVEYGNPSGHSWFSAIFGFVVLMDFWGSGKHFINIWISIAAVILMPLSRMYLGAHSLNQVLEGLILGLAMCLLYVLVLKSLIHIFLKQFNKKGIWKAVIIAAHIIYMIPFIAHRKQELPPQWKQNILQKCNVTMNQFKLNSLMFIVNAILVNLVTGIAFGYENLSKTELGKHYLSGKWQINEQKYELTKGYILFFAIECLCVLSGLVMGAIIYFLIPHLTVAYIALSLGGFASGYIYTTKSCHFLGKYKIIREVQP